MFHLRDKMPSYIRKTALIALALAPLAAFADEPPFKAYGRVDIGPLYQTNAKDGKELTLSDLSSNRLGFIGESKIGEGLTAFFRLEHRFYLGTGIEKTGKRFWSDKAWVGIRSETLGALSAGRTLTVGNTIVGGSDSEALPDSIGSVNSRKGRIENNIDNSMFYESPWMQPAGDTKLRGFAQIAQGANGEQPYGVGFQLRNGPLKFDAGYQHDVSKDGSAPELEDRKSNSVFMGAAWNFGATDLKGTYATSKGYKGEVSDFSKYRMTSTSVSLNRNFGKWDLGLMANHKTETDTSGKVQPSIDKFAVGYWYSFTKTEKFMPTIAYERLSGAYKSGTNGYGEKKNKKDNLYIQIGFRKEF